MLKGKKKKKITFDQSKKIENSFSISPYSIIFCKKQYPFSPPHCRPPLATKGGHNHHELNSSSTVQPQATLTLNADNSTTVMTTPFFLFFSFIFVKASSLFLFPQALVHHILAFTIISPHDSLIIPRNNHDLERALSQPLIKIITSITQTSSFLPSKNPFNHIH